MTIWPDVVAIAPIWLTAAGAAAVLLLTVAGGYRHAAPRGAHLAIVALLALGAAMWILLGDEGTTTRAFSGAIIVDGLATVFGLIALCGAAIAILFAESYLREHEQSRGEFIALILLSTSGMLMLVMAGDLISLFIGIEVMSLGVYVLAGYRRSARSSQEAALKYFIYGAFASAFVLFGIALIYGEVGRITGSASVGLAAIAKSFASPGVVSLLGWIGVAMVLAGLAFKVAAVPFHMWAPDVYEGAPTPATGFMAVGVKAAAFAGLCRFVAATFLATGARGTETAVQIFEILAILTMVLGNLLAVRQKQIKRMLAYSSIAHAGYIFVGVAAFVANPTGEGITGIAYYLMGYTAMTLGAFGVVSAFERREDRRLDLAIDRLCGVGHRYPAIGLAMIVFMFSLAGVPPTAGFFGKLALFAAAIEAGRASLVVVAVFASAVGAYYYLRVLVVMYMQATPSDERRTASPWLAAGLWVCATITIAAGLLPETYLHFARTALKGWLG